MAMTTFNPYTSSLQPKNITFGAKRFGTFGRFHAHIYYSTADEKRKAEILKRLLESEFRVRVRQNDKPVGPHLQPMLAIHFLEKKFSRLTQWLMNNRNGLKVLIHPDDQPKKNDLINHRDRSVWMGTEDGNFPINMDFFSPDQKK